MSKFIFVTGGVVSGLGKGVSAASLGRLLKARGFKIFVQKLDPYLNVDPGTMSPLQHGEVYVTIDGAETDLDLGHYERFIGEEFTQESNYTSGQIYSSLLQKERRGGFNGETVQVIPHVTNAIKAIIENGAKTSQADFVIIEIGGTVGDIESQAFIHAIAELGILRPKDMFFIHVSYIAYLTASKEFKTKPTQHAISTLRAYGIRPNVLLLRSHSPISDEIKKKVAYTSMINPENIIGLHDVENIYSIPLYLEDQKLANKVLDYFNMKQVKPQLDDWKGFVNLINLPTKKTINVGMVGKYTKFQDAYMSIIEALKIAGIYAQIKIKLKWLSSEDFKSQKDQKKLDNLDGIIILPGFGKRGFEGKVIVAKIARDNNIPTLGICYGMQAMTVEQARRQGIKDATSFENDKTGTFVINILDGKTKDQNLGGTLRLGNWTTNLKKGSLAARAYGQTKIVERHRHRFEVDPKYISQIEDQNFIFSGLDAKNNLAEVCEDNSKTFYLGTQYHPEFTANPLKNHKLFKAFVTAIDSAQIKGEK